MPGTDADTTGRCRTHQQARNQAYLSASHHRRPPVPLGPVCRTPWDCSAAAQHPTAEPCKTPASRSTSVQNIIHYDSPHLAATSHCTRAQALHQSLRTTRSYMCHTSCWRALLAPSLYTACGAPLSVGPHLVNTGFGRLTVPRACWKASSISSVILAATSAGTRSWGTLLACKT